jgi:uncharacterized membrane protein YkvA (DUF1232 family)
VREETDRWPRRFGPRCIFRRRTTLSAARPRFVVAVAVVVIAVLSFPVVYVQSIFKSTIFTSTHIAIRERLRGWARQIKRDVHALFLTAQDPRVPWYAKVAAIAVAAYALSPIDLISDFIPIVGYLDDLLIVPLGILLAVKLVPAALMEEFRIAAASADGERALGRWGAAIIVMLWLLGITMAAMWLRSLVSA